MTGKDEYELDRVTESDPTTAAAPGAEPEEQVTEIRHSIEQTRAEMSETIEELQDRLSPSHLKDQVKEQVREQYEQVKDTVREATIGRVEDMVERVSDTMYETRRSVVETIKANPVPAAIAGIGLAWLWMNRRTGYSGPRHGDRHRIGRGDGDRWQDSNRRDARHDPYDRFDQIRGDRSEERSSGAGVLSKAGEAVSDVAGQVQQGAGRLAQKAKQTVSGVVDQAQETAGQWADQAQYQARRVEDGFNETMRESPLAVGAVALALGTAIGLAMPRTRTEDEWMGEARDTLVDKAQAVAHDTIEQVQEVAEKVTDAMADTGTNAARGSSQSSSAALPTTPPF